MLRDLIQKFSVGTQYAFTGIGCFYRMRSLWKFAIIPMLVMLLLYAAVWALVFAWLAPMVIGWLDFPSLPDWMETSIHVLIYFAAITIPPLVFLICSSSVYEMFGSLIFDYLIEAFQKETLKHPVASHSWGEQLRFGLASFAFALMTLLFAMVLLVVSLFLPVAGQILTILILGYFLGHSYMQGSAFAHGYQIQQLTQMVPGHRIMILGFGICAYLLLAIPLLSILFMPGLVIGGSMMFHHRIFSGRSDSAQAKYRIEP